MSARPRVRTFRRDDRDQLTDLVNSPPLRRRAGRAALGQQRAREPGAPARRARRRPVGRRARDVRRRVPAPGGGRRAPAPVHGRAGGERRLPRRRPRAVAPRHAARRRGPGAVRRGPRGRGRADGRVPRPARRVAGARGVRGRAAPFAGVYGVPEQWPHVREALERAGFRPGEHAETVLLAPTSALPAPSRAGRRRPAAHARPRRGRAVHRAPRHGDGRVRRDRHDPRPRRAAGRDGRHRRAGGPRARPGADDALLAGVLAEARAWLELAGVHRVLVGTDATDHEEIAQLRAWGFRELTTVSRGWRLAAPNVVR